MWRSFRRGSLLEHRHHRLLVGGDALGDEPAVARVLDAPQRQDLDADLGQRSIGAFDLLLDEHARLPPLAPTPQNVELLEERAPPEALAAQMIGRPGAVAVAGVVAHGEAAA